jgi:hypothetical protein
MSKTRAKRGKYKTKPNIRQMRVVNNILSGKYKTKKDALVAAGYSKKSSSAIVLGRKGVQQYLDKFEHKALSRWKMPIRSKLQNVYLDGLDADKPHGKKKIPDYKIRKEYADTIAEQLGLLNSKKNVGRQQFNFFLVDKESREQLNETFNSIVKDRALNSQL